VSKKSSASVASSSVGSGPERTSKRTVKRSKPKHRRPATIEQDIEKYEAIAEAAQARMLDPEVYTSKELSAKALDEHADAERRIAKLWDELESSTAHYE
jgi:DNA-binding protein H-NS